MRNAPTNKRNGRTQAAARLRVIEILGIASLVGMGLGACAWTKRAEDQTKGRPTLTSEPWVAAPRATASIEFPGLHNFVTYSPGLYSGGAPESPDAFRTLRDMGVKTIISGPYGYEIAPIEMFFARMKSTNLNPEGRRTGKK